MKPQSILTLCSKLMLATTACWILTSCASSYNRMQPQNFTYEKDMFVVGDSAVKVAYKYNVFEETGNGKYSHYEDKRNFSMLSMRISNNSDDTISIPQTIAFFDGNLPVEPLRMYTSKSEMQQKDESAVVLLFDPLLHDYSNEDLWIYLPLAINESVAWSADKQFSKDLKAHYLVNKPIPPHSVVYGLIAFPVLKNTPLWVKKRTNSALR